jgi:glycogen debranching enzyme
VELQGYLFAARLAMAEILLARGEPAEAARLTSLAWRIRRLVEERFWMHEERYYALALDGEKRQVKSIASNPGHLLFAGLPTATRARCLAARMREPDLSSGWGLRTLSATHPSFNPLSYQLGSVWPFDNALVAAGLFRYGLSTEACRHIHAILEASKAFERWRLPELYCGLDRSHGLPVPYDRANSPQAWSAAVPLLVAQLFLGILPDAPRGRVYLQPWLPSWLPRLTLHGIAVGRARMDVTIERRGRETVIERIVTAGDLAILRGMPEAPLWGRPMQPPPPR